MMEYEHNVWGEDADVGVTADGVLGDEDCSVCLHPITNPIGTDCYLKHVEMWLVSQGMSYAESKVVKDNIKKRLPKNNSNQEMCVVCGKEHLSICSYCFVFLVSSILNKLGFAEKFEEDFEEVFSYKGGDYEFRNSLGM